MAETRTPFMELRRQHFHETRMQHLRELDIEAWVAAQINATSPSRPTDLDFADELLKRVSNHD